MHARRAPLLFVCSLVGAAVICCSSLFVAISQRRQAAAAKAAAAAAAAAANEASTRRASAARLRHAGAAAGDGSLEQPLLLGSDQLEGGSEDEGSKGPLGRRSRDPSSRVSSLPAGGSDEDWASAAEGGLSTAVSLHTAASWHTAGSGGGSGGEEPAAREGEKGDVLGLEADLKEALAEAIARDLSAEVQQPDTPAAPPQLQPNASVDSLPPLGASPDGRPWMLPRGGHGDSGGKAAGV